MRSKKDHVIVENKENQIWCNRYMPEGYEEKKLPAIILSHGYNGYADSWDFEGEYFAEHGILAFALDFCGASKRSRSSGKLTDMTLRTEQENLKAVLEYVKNCSFVDENQVFLFGESQGGLISALVAEKKADDVRGLFLYFPALCIPDNWKKMYPDLAEVPEKIEFWDNTLGRKFVEDVHTYDLDNIFGDYEGPIHVFHGDMDEIVSVDYSKKYVDKYKDAILTVINGQGHGFTNDVREKNIAEICKEIFNELK